VAHISSPELLVLHGLRVMGWRAWRPWPALCPESWPRARTATWLWSLRVDQSRDFADMNGWALTGAGRAENERRLSVELDPT